MDISTCVFQRSFAMLLIVTPVSFVNVPVVTECHFSVSLFAVELKIPCIKVAPISIEHTSSVHRTTNGFALVPTAERVAKHSAVPNAKEIPFTHFIEFFQRQ